MQLACLTSSFLTSLFALSLGSLASGQFCFPDVDASAWTSAGTTGDGYSQSGSLTFDGRLVAFDSAATNLVPGDTNGARDVFVRDLQSGAVERVSTTFTGTQGNGESSLPTISADGRYVAFSSYATNFALNDSNGTQDIYVKDRQTGSLAFASVSTFGFAGNGSSWVPRISSNGRYVAFQSTATNLLPFGEFNGHTDVYVRDLQAGTTVLASVTWNAAVSNGSSYLGRVTSDGRYVLFRSSADNMSFLDTNSHEDIFLRDLQTGTTTIESIAPGSFFPVVANGPSQSSDISEDGRYVVFTSSADNLTNALDSNGTLDVFLRDRIGNTTVLVSRSNSFFYIAGDGLSQQANISDDGRYISFVSRSSNLLSGDTNGQKDIFLVDSQLLGTQQSYIQLMSRAHLSGALSTVDSFNAGISGDGKAVVFDSTWSGFVPADGNGLQDTFVARRPCFTATNYCQAKLTSNGCTPSIRYLGVATSSADGGFQITCETAINQKTGLLLYGLSGQAAIPFQGGTLCVQPPTRRGPLLFSGGNAQPTADCSGRFVLDMDGYASGAIGDNALPQLTIAGTTVNAQWWGRDPGFAAPNDTLLSGGLQYSVLP